MLLVVGVSRVVGPLGSLFGQNVVRCLLTSALCMVGRLLLLRRTTLLAAACRVVTVSVLAWVFRKLVWLCVLCSTVARTVVSWGRRRRRRRLVPAVVNRTCLICCAFSSRVS